MPLIEQFRNVRIFKRSRRLKGRPEWQDEIPDSQAGRDAYRIAAEHESRFSRAFLEAVRTIITPEVEKDFFEAWKTGSIREVLATLPIFVEGDEETAKAWGPFLRKINVAYFDVIDESGKVAAKELNKKFRTSAEWTMSDKPEGADEVIEKAEVAPVVPVNPYSLKWIEERGLELATQGISAQQKAVVNSIIEGALEEGLRPTDVLREIKANIGLTDREYNAVLNRRDLLDAQGYSERDAAGLTEKYRQDLLTKRAKRIARTETIAAQSQGRKAAWELAAEQGKLPDVERVWMAPPPSANPNRPCEICLELDGKTARLGEPYESLYEGAVDAPPVHPNCLPGDAAVTAFGVTAASKRWFDGDILIIRTSDDKRVVCTPNHPILGRHGWRAAYTFNVGDDVLCQRGIDDIASPLVDDEHQHAIPTVETVANLFEQLDFSQAVPVPVSPEDFHGDGINEDVAVIRSYRFLENQVSKAEVAKRSREGRFFLGGDCQLAFIRLCSFLFFLHRQLAATRRFVGRGDSPFTLSKAHMLRQVVHRFASVARLDAGEQEQPANFSTSDAPGFGQRLLAHSGHVVPRNVVNVDVQRFSGHVYNLQTQQGFYTVDTIFTHNCRCTETLRRKA